MNQTCAFAAEAGEKGQFPASVQEPGFGDQRRMSKARFYARWGGSKKSSATVTLAKMWG